MRRNEYGDVIDDERAAGCDHGMPPDDEPETRGDEAMKYRAHIVYSGRGDSYEKYGVHADRYDATSQRDRLEHLGARIEDVIVTRRELEDYLEDDLTDDQLAAYKTVTP